MLTWDELTTNYISRYFNLIKKVTEPLFHHFNITYFTYHRITATGHYDVLISSPHFAEEYVSNQFYLIDPFLREPDNYEPGLYKLEQHVNEETWNHALDILGNIVNADTEVILIEKKQNSTHFFGFAGKTLTSHLPTLYLNTPKTLKSYGNYFIKQMKPVLQKMADEPIQLPNLKGDDYFVKEPIKPILNGTTHQTFLQEIGKGALLKKGRSITKRERQCLRLLLKGYTAKETASLLNLSSRTVESYFENIKNKFSCWTKREVFATATQLQEHGLL